MPQGNGHSGILQQRKDTLWEEQKRLKNPDIVPVDLSDKLSAMKLKLIEAATMI